MARTRCLTAAFPLALLLLALLCRHSAHARRISHRRLVHLHGHQASSSDSRHHHQQWQFCAEQGGPAPAAFKNVSITCLRLFDAPSAPIRVPPSNSSVMWGQISVARNTAPISAPVFIDANGTEHRITAGAHPPTDFLELMTVWVLIVVRAEVDPTSNNVTSFMPVLYVPYGTILATMVNSTFEGVLYNSEPRPVGPNETSWVRWTFTQNISVTNPSSKYGVLLQGSFDNLFRSVKDSTGVCRPALCSDPTRQSDACQYYEEFFGSETPAAMTLNWDPNMHFAGDTELVPIFKAHSRQYMASFTELFDLLNPYDFLGPHEHVFLAHGTPMGIPQNFTGTLTKGTQLELC